MNWCGVWQFFKKIEPYYPWILLCVILVIVFLIIFLLIAYFVKPKSDPKGIADEPKSDAKQVNHRFDLPPYLFGFSEFSKFFKRGDFAQNFFDANQFLRRSFPGVNYKYSVPWFVLLGPEASGKTTLAKHLEHRIGCAIPDFPQLFPRQDCTYSFFSNAVICNLAGDHFAHAKTADCNDAGFRTFLTLLSRYRQRTPLNGIVLSIPVAELISTDKKMVMERAKFYHNQIGALQNYLNIRLPVYVTVTHIDQLPGFKQFVDHLPPQFHQYILGWSAPYDLSTAYTTKWCDDAFDHIDQYLKKLIFELSTYASGWEQNGGLYVFWKELVQLKDNLKIYCDQIFVGHVYKNQPCLRGIYFTGQYNDDLMFAQQLFEEKIFQEAHLVAPIQTLLTTHHAKYFQYGLLGLMAWFSIFGTQALWRFQQQRNEVLPIVYKMNQLFDRMQGTPITDDAEMALIYEEAIQQLSLLSHVNRNQLFFSFAIPATWVSPFRKNVNHTLHRTAQLILVRSLYYALLLKIKHLVHMRPAPADASQNLGQLLLPESSPEYKLVERFVTGLKDVQDYVEKFNQLQSYHDPKVLDDLMKYIFKTSLPEHVYHQYIQIETFLFNRLFPPIDLHVYAKALHRTMGVLYQNFYNALFDGNTIGSLPYRLQELANQLSPNKPDMPDINLFRSTQDSIKIIKKLFGKEGKTWMDESYFNPSKGFSKFWETIDGVAILGKPVSQLLVDQTGLGFGNLQKQIQALYRDFSGAEEPKEFEAQKTSQLIFVLDKELDKVFDQDYMQAPASPPVSAMTNKDEFIAIDSSAFKPIAKALSQEEKFSDEDISKMPVATQKKLRNLALEGATNFIRYQVNSNQKTIKQLPKDATDSEREALLGGIKFFDDTLSLIKILETLPSKEAVDLRDGLNKSAQYLLTELSALLKNYGLYMPRDLAKMEWWDGNSGAAFKAYGAVDQASLLLGLRHQFELIKKLVQKAGPIIDYLKSHVADTENLDHALIDKWDTIVTAVKEKETNKGSSLTDLEKFITEDMNAITFMNVADKIPLSDIVGTSHDYFVQARKTIQKALLARAEILSRTSSIKAYNCIAGFFNKNLAGKFPFADEKTTPDDLSLETLWDFFALFDEKGGTPEKILANVQEVPGFDDQMAFLQTMYEVRQLFDGWIQGKSEAKDPLFDVEIEFRVNRQSEQNGQYVYHLWFNPTSTEKLKNISGGPLVGTWRYGEPVTLGLDWASPSQSAPVPVADPNRPYMSVDRLRVEMTFGGNWALFALLRALQTSDTDVKRYLRVTVPQSNGMAAVIYHRVAVMRPAKNSKNPKREYLKIPVFPFSAPDLPCMKDYLGEAVLLEKRLNCVSSKDDAICKKFTQDADARTITCVPEKKKTVTEAPTEEPASEE